MQVFDEIKKYCSTVCDQIRWKKAKIVVEKEIAVHIYDQRDAYIAGGDDEKTATDKAILQMGDAVSVGLELDKTHRPKPQWTMIVLTGVFMLIGMLVNYFIDSSVNSLNNFSIIPYILAFAVFVGCYYIDFTIFGKYAKAFYVMTIVASIIGFLTSVQINGRAYWRIGFFPFTMAYLSLIFPFVFALWVYAMRGKGYVGILLSGLGYCPLVFILMLVPHIAGTILFTISSLIVLCFAVCKGWFGVNKKYGLMLVLIPTIIVSGVLLAFTLPIISRRDGDIMGAGYLLNLIKDLIAGSVMWGKGVLPEQIPDITKLPNISTDYSLTYLIHQFGFVVVLVISILIIAFSIVGIKKILKQKNILGSLVALSILTTYILQSGLYIAGNIGYTSFASFTLPFISYGKISLLINAGLIGLMLSVFRTGDIYKDGVFSLIKFRKLVAYEDGKIIIDLKAKKI